MRGADRLEATRIEHADSKQLIEAYLRERPVRATVLGREIPYQQMPLDMVRQWAGEEVATMFENFENNTDFLDLEALHAKYPAVGWHSYAEWAKTVDWDKILAG
ncbi:HSCARG protein [[Actinomadura] parvosata subsp. kistnae]|uniref:NmrA-like domain-containing protein n=1 Tax=[Actinomadura] parvosata subsp. kistnae TaxID=1909395 RepID=A0A1U9ZWE2_9ACTN|nr:hypothetical protein [Nonomuraea sp. ATCC 55076]AQZ62252.1 hypothetical protein BKM31_12965 [Nonomuraea sp. ATCC 55076]SPL99756.1 HSCARG protein [Actinomadura parvosata subsp. kistnae]